MRLMRPFAFLWFGALIELINCDENNNNRRVMDCFNATDADNLRCLLENAVSRNVSHELIEEVAVLSDKLDKVLASTNYVWKIGDRTMINMSKVDGDNVNIYINDSRNVTSRKMQMKMQNILPFLIAPAFLLAGIMPWILPKIQLAVFLVVVLNNMVFWQALFALVRNYVFNKAKDEHIIYLNHGYKNANVHHPPKIIEH